MKLLFGILILGAAAPVFGQEAPVAPIAPVRPHVAVRAALSGDVISIGTMKNAPFTAEERGETVKIMPDGNRIVDGWTGTIARNSEGRIRRDITSGKAGAGARPFVFSGHMDHPAVIALGTGDGTRHVTVTKVGADGEPHVLVAPRASGEGVSVITTTEGGDEAKLLIERKLNGSLLPEGVRAGVKAESGRILLEKAADDGKIQSRKENLGMRDFGGVQAEGVRVTRTFAPGAVGNERELEVVSETWFSKELGVVVYSKRTDPRLGETTYQMTNITRAEPDASLFTNK